MELPVEVLIHSEILGVKGGKGTLLDISPNGYYEVNFGFGDKVHRVLFPIAATLVIAQEAEERHAALAAEIER